MSVGSSTLPKSRDLNPVLGYPFGRRNRRHGSVTNMQQEALEITRRNLNVQPTVVIRAGYQFDVMVNWDMVFDGPYQPIPARR